MVSIISLMVNGPHPPRWQNMIVRILRWRPESHRQVWLISAPFVASGAVLGGLAAALIQGGFSVNIFLWSLASAIFLYIARGVIQSYRLDQRRATPSRPE
jgi:uncharacterized membrane protein YfcA